MLWRGKHKFSHIEVAPGGATYGFGTYNTKGRNYFVNNITGSSTNDGLTWDRAMDEPSTAVTASEVYRADRETGDEYIANTIVIQGTSTAYATVTDLGEWTRIIGLNALPMAKGICTGAVRIGAATTDGADIAASMHGNLLANIVFCFGGSSTYGLRLASASYIFHIYGCTFNQEGASAASAIHFTAGAANGIIEENIITRGCGGTQATYGLRNAGGAFSGMEIRNNMFWVGSTALLSLANTLQTASFIHDNCFFGTSAIGAENACTSASYGDGCALLYNNHFATTAYLTDQISWANAGFLGVNWGSGGEVT